MPSTPLAKVSHLLNIQRAREKRALPEGGNFGLAVTTPDRPPVVGQHPGQHPSHLRDYEYERLGTVSLLAGLDLHSGRVTETISDTHTSADFITFLKKIRCSVTDFI